MSDFIPDSEKIDRLEAENTALRKQLAAALPAAKRDAERQFSEFFASRVPGLTSVEQHSCAGGRKVLIRLRAGDLAFEREIEQREASWGSDCERLAEEADWFFDGQRKANGDQRIFPAPTEIHRGSSEQVIDLGQMRRLNGHAETADGVE